VCPQGKSAIDAILTAQLFRQFRSSAKFVSAESGADENGSGSYFASVCSGYPPQFPVTADDRRDVTFPRLNRACWYLYMVGGLFTIAALLAGVVAR
jgi:hypothetical protein